MGANLDFYRGMESLEQVRMLQRLEAMNNATNARDAIKDIMALRSELAP